MGRHTQPGTGAPTPDTGFWVRAAVAGVLVVVALVWWVSSRGGDDPVGTTSGDRTGSPTAASTGGASRPAPMAAAWRPYVRGGVEVTAIDCGHDELLDPGPAAAIGRLIADRLATAN